MDGGFGGWQGEDQPAVAGVYGREAEDVSQEVPVCFCVRAVKDYVRAEDHELLLEMSQAKISEGWAASTARVPFMR
jgi:hypothetical protein